LIFNLYVSEAHHVKTLAGFPEHQKFGKPGCKVGFNWQLEFNNDLNLTNMWMGIATITITNNSQYFFDDSATGQPSRFSRVVHRMSGPPNSFLK